jgi:hypothetical protein
MAYTTIDKPSDYFETVLYAGNSGTQSITSLDFQPDWCWFKARNNTDTHAVFDSVRGVQERLIPNNDTAEGTQSNGLTHFLSNGFTVGDAGIVNQGYNYVSWNWKAGTSVSGNTTGSGTAKTYTGSVNTDAGFSIISFTGNGTSGHTIPHNLGVAPAMVILKRYDSSNNWRVGHNGLTSWEYRLTLEDTSAQASQSAVFNSTAPTSSVVTLGNSGSANGNGATYIMYSFAEKQGYSKFGSYTGNGNANGTFVYLGFKPAFVLVKDTSSSNNWRLSDNKRNEFNLVDDFLFPSSNIVENAISGSFDFLSNGFKARSSNAGMNASGSTYIYMAFAENPYVTSTGVPATAR